MNEIYEKSVSIESLQTKSLKIIRSIYTNKDLYERFQLIDSILNEDELIQYINTRKRHIINNIEKDIKQYYNLSYICNSLFYRLEKLF